MGGWRDSPFEDELVGHFLFGPYKLQKLLDIVDFWDTLDESLTPLDKDPSHCLSAITYLLIFYLPLYFAISLSLRA